MIYHNRTQADFAPRGRTGAGPTEGLGRIDDLYYRSRIFPGLSVLVSQCIEGELPFSELTIDAYQAWVETGWKSPHGTYHAADRLSRKGDEEVRELEEALGEYHSAGDPKHLLEEAGDNLWIHTARSSNSGNVISDSVKTRLYEYIAGTKVYIEDRPTEPQWYDAAAQLAIKRGSPTLGEIDGITREGFIARPSPVMNLFDDEVFSPYEAMLDLRVFGRAASGLNLRQHDREDGRWDVSVRSYEILAADVGTFTSEAYFRIASLAHYAGSTLADVVAVNMHKINQRVRDGLIDKTDGARPVG